MNIGSILEPGRAIDIFRCWKMRNEVKFEVSGTGRSQVRERENFQLKKFLLLYKYAAKTGYLLRKETFQVPCEVRCTWWASFIPCMFWSECWVVPSDGWQCLCVTWPPSTPTLTSDLTLQDRQTVLITLHWLPGFLNTRFATQSFLSLKKILIKGKIFTRQQV